MSEALLSTSKILIVDDEPANVRLLERFLEVQGNKHFRSTTDSKQAIPLIFEYEPDLVVLDLMMPQPDGYTILEQIRAAFPGGDAPPVLVLTADATPDAKLKALRAGARDFLTKPFDQAEVALRSRNLLENRHLNRALRNQNGQLEILVKERTSDLQDALDRLKTAQESVVNQERLRALGMMSGGIAHDFNNVLTMILGYGELLLPFVQTSGSDKEREQVRHIVEAAQDAKHVVGRLRDFYRPSDQADVRVPLDLAALAEQAVSLTAPKWKAGARARGVQINVNCVLGPVHSVLGSAPEIREVMTNLIFNAVDAMPDGGSITVATEERNDHARLSVRDTGCGMTPEQRKRCLEPFFTTKGKNGTGLGLAVVYGIIQRHGGDIEIESEPGVGTCFTISLPVSNETIVLEKPVVEALNRTLNILVVDDQEIICELLVENLRGDGHSAEAVYNGHSALEALGIQQFDLIITDQSMPGMSGSQLAEKVATQAPGTPVILLSGYGDELSAGGPPPHITLQLSKPISQGDLRRALAQAMSTSTAKNSGN